MNSQITLPVTACSAWCAKNDAPLPPASFLDPQIRRRLSSLDHIALHVAHACVEDEATVQLVFASRHGELARSAELLTQLARGEAPSPMAFSLSVLNAAPGLFSISRRDRSATSAVSSGTATFPMALIEAAAQAWAAPDATVVLAFADEPPPAVYQSIVDAPRYGHAIGVRLEARSAEQAVVMSWQPSERDDEAEAAPQVFRACFEERRPGTWHGGGRAWHWEAHGHA
jgi:hypothetical protein